MSLLSSVFGIEARYSVENPSVPLTASNIAADYIGSAPASSGANVTTQTVLGYPAMWRGINLIAGYVAKVALPTYKRIMEDGQENGKERDKRHPAYRLLMRQPNPDMTAFTFKQVLQSHALMHGNGYAAIMRDGRGDATDLLLMDPMKTWPVRREGELSYMTYVGGKLNGIRSQDVFHLKGLSCEGIYGISVVDKLRDALGIGMAAQEFAGRFFKNNARPSYAIKLPGALRDDQAVARFRENINNIHGGPANTLRPMLLEQGAELISIGFNNQDSQFLQTREFEVRQIANILGLPPHKLGDSSRTSYNSLEQENQSFLDDTLDFWFGSWEAEANCKLLREKEKSNETHFTEFHRQSLVRANLTDRTNAYHSALQDGWMNRDEVRARENLNPLPDGQGKVFLQPLNMAPAGGDTKETPDETVDDAPGETQPLEEPTRSTQALQDAVEHEVTRMVRRLSKASQRAAKNPAKFLAFIDSIESDHGKVVIESLSPTVRALCSVLGGKEERKAIEGAKSGIFTEAREAMLTASDGLPDELPGLLSDAFTLLESTLPASIVERIKGAE